MALPVPRPALRSVLPRSLVNLGLGLVVLAALAVPLYFALENTRREVFYTRAQGNLESAEQLVRKEFLQAVGDLRTLGAVPQLASFLAGDAGEDRELLVAFLRHVVGNYRRHDGVRVLGPDGVERVRVQQQRGAVVEVEAARLRGHADRAYFQAAMALPRDAVYVSALALAGEGGALQQPLTPTLTLAMPVFDAAGRRRGVLVLDYLAGGMLESLGPVMEREGQQGMLLDGEGYWLIDGEPERTWGLQRGRPQEVFSARYPQEWARLQREEEGRMHTANGLFVFRTVRPLLPAPGAAAGVPEPMPWSGPPGEDYRWTLVSRVPQAEFAAASVLREPQAQLVLAAIVAGLAVVSYLLAFSYVRTRDARRREQQALEEIRDLYENAPCGYQSLDSEGRIVRINHTALDWLGYRQEELVDKVRLPQLLTNDSQEQFQTLFARIKAGDSVRDMRLELVRKDGSLLPASLTSTVVKDRSGRFLLTRSTVFDMTDQRQLERELERQAHTDALTGACNRRHFNEMGQREIKRAQRNHRPLSVMLLDVDHFKRINDTHGHDAGDLVLKALTMTLVSALRDADIIARLGGEEFVAMLPDTALEPARIVAERARQSLAELAVVLPAGGTLCFTVSIGVAQFHGGMDGLEALLKAADEAMYRAKHGGRNRVEVVPLPGASQHPA